jgi:hypothetical protein
MEQLKRECIYRSLVAVGDEEQNHKMKSSITQYALWNDLENDEIRLLDTVGAHRT